MPAIKSGKVLVTGSNGYISVWIVRLLLEAGFSVRGTIRTPDKAAYLQKLFASYGDKLEFVVVKDITLPGAFDEAVKGVDAIEHLASPFHMKSSHPDDMIIPAVQGTHTILQSALQHGKNVKRIVITSSSASVDEFLDYAKIYTEDDWNNQSVREAKEKGKDCPPVHSYRASKTLAEKEAWKFVEEHNGQLTFDIVAICPVYVYGPVIQEVKSVDALNTSMASWYNNVVKGTADDDTLANVGGSWVDVRDVAATHVKSLMVEGAGNKRILNSAGEYKWQDWILAARKIDPKLSAGNTSYDPEKAVHLNRFGSTRMHDILGIAYHTEEETARDSLANFREHGWY
ncbi:methylglyoxal reductase (NADPH-dependent) gre2 [Steccherinum ochraceum]|uniref:Methylglyoxal reductase (NADPH-dependent) gre2 n=1 Tax=Steccherinum ochraceum TaxID=92696 RepID=A0A4R0RCD9_9APHY|nr:methylglyoxal reductase (NADPH-dependent) gre2 [Steccherinum ochraceum]